MPEQQTPHRPPDSNGRRGIGTWGGIAIGIGAVLLMLLLIALFSFLVLGRCPMCEWMMGRPN